MTIMRSRLSLATAILTIGVGFATSAWADSFFFSTGIPDGRLGALSRRAGPGKIETETADDFILAETTVISRATITGLIPLGTPLSNIRDIEVEIYHVFALDSNVGRTSGPPTFSTPAVPTRVNSPADVEIAGATRDGSSGTLEYRTRLVTPTFTVPQSVVNRISVLSGGDGPQTGQEVEISINFTTPIILPAGHYFYRPEVLVTGGDFLYLSVPKGPAPDLQAWIRNSNLTPDWLRIGTDIIGGTTFGMSFSLTGDTVPAGTPGLANCHGKTVSALAHQYGGMDAASLALGASSVNDLQDAIDLYCKP